MRNMLPAVDLPLNILLITPVFFLLFIVLIYWTYKKTRKSIYQDIGNLPLEPQHSTELRPKSSAELNTGEQKLVQPTSK